MEKNNFLNDIYIDTQTKCFVIKKGIFVYYSSSEIDELLDYFITNYKDYKLFYCENGEPITPSCILALYRIHECFLEHKINTKKFVIFYENKSDDYERLLGFFQFTFYHYPYHLNFVTPDAFFNSGDYPFPLKEDFEKTFLSLNRTAKEHKIKFKSFFDENGLKDKSYYSFLWKDEKNFDENYIQHTHARHEELIHLYDNTAINLLCESNFNSTYLSIQATFLSEKVFRAIAFPRIFVLIGPYQGLAYLRKMGFKTFSNVIDESYDEIYDDDARMEKIEKLILELSNKSKEEIYNMWKECLEIFEHNRKSILYHAHSMRSFFMKNLPKEYMILDRVGYFPSLERTKKLKEYNKYENNDNS